MQAKVSLRVPYRLDVLCLQDTRHTEKDVPFKDLLPSGTEIRHSPLPSGGSGRRIGGQLIIISPKWNNRFQKEQDGTWDPHGTLPHGSNTTNSNPQHLLATKRNHSEAVDPSDCRHEPEVGSPWLKMVEWLKKHRPNCKVQSLGIHTDHSQPMGICTRVQN